MPSVLGRATNNAIGDLRHWWETPVQNRYNILPLAEQPDGSTVPAVPGMLAEPFSALARVMANAGRPTTYDDAGVPISGIGALHPGDGLNAVGLAPMGNLALGTIPHGVGVFGGRLAKTADHNALARAERMAAEGVPREDIWNQTGWFQGADQKWRFEIDDSGMSFKDFPEGDAKHGGGWFGRDAVERQSGPMGEIVDHPALFAAYPDLAGNTLTLRRGWGLSDGGSYNNPLTGAIGINGYNTAEMRGSLVHELQHGIQSAEGFAAGSNVTREWRPWRRGDDAHYAYERTQGETEARNARNRYENEPYKNKIPSGQPELPYTGSEDYTGRRPQEFPPYATEDTRRASQQPASGFGWVMLRPEVGAPLAWGGYDLGRALGLFANPKSASSVPLAVSMAEGAQQHGFNLSRPYGDIDASLVNLFKNSRGLLRDSNVEDFDPALLDQIQSVGVGSKSIEDALAQRLEKMDAAREHYNARFGEHQSAAEDMNDILQEQYDTIAEANPSFTSHTTELPGSNVGYLNDFAATNEGRSLFENLHGYDTLIGRGLEDVRGVSTIPVDSDLARYFGAIDQGQANAQSIGSLAEQLGQYTDFGGPGYDKIQAFNDRRVGILDAIRDRMRDRLMEHDIDPLFSNPRAALSAPLALSQDSNDTLDLNELLRRYGMTP